MNVHNEHEKNDRLAKEIYREKRRKFSCKKLEVNKIFTSFRFKKRGQKKKRMQTHSKLEDATLNKLWSLIIVVLICFIKKRLRNLGPYKFRRKNLSSCKFRFSLIYFISRDLSLSFFNHHRKREKERLEKISLQFSIVNLFPS